MFDERRSTTVYMAGLTHSTDLDADQLPTGGLYHNSVPGGGADGFLLKYSTSPNIALAYGTLIGGEGDDAILDIERGSECDVIEQGCSVYLTGETNSTTGMLIANDQPSFYHQASLGNMPGSTLRDAYIIKLATLSMSPYWSTYVGGQQADKGWGLAATAASIYLVGGTDSDQLSFPLKEYNTTSPLDWYDGDFLNNSEGMNWGYYAFNDASYAYLFSYFPQVFGDPWTGFSPDGFIASFDLTPSVGIDENSNPGSGMRVETVDPTGLWNIHLPDTGTWSAHVYNSTGSCIKRGAPSNDKELLIDLRGQAKGLYVVTFMDATGHLLGLKLLK